MFLGVDIGTYEAKAVVIDGSGQAVASASLPHRLEVPEPGWAEHDADNTWWNAFVSLTRELVERQGVDAHAIQAVGCSGIGPCVLPLDSDRRPLRPAILYGVDTRAHDQCERLTEMIGAEAILARTGAALTSQAAGPKITWIRDNEPETYRQTELFVTCQGYLVGRLTGEWVMDHSTAAYYGPCYDLGAAGWHGPWCELVGATGRLPRLGWSTEIAGRVSAQAATETGLVPGTPVVVGTADAPAEAVAAGVSEPGDLMIMYGSSIFMIEVLDRLIVDERMWAAPFVFENSFILAGGTSTAGTATRWWLDILGADPDDTDASRFDRFVAEAAAAEPGGHGLVVLPHLSGERTPLHDPGARGVISGLDLTHTRGDIGRALLEGIAIGIRWNIEVLDQVGAAPRRVRAVGGGTKNPVWLQAVTDAIKRPQGVVRGAAAAEGSAVLAAVGLGAIGRDRLASLVLVDDESHPDPELGGVYDELSARSHAIYLAHRELRAGD